MPYCFPSTEYLTTIEYVQVKGLETEVWRVKWALFCALY